MNDDAGARLAGLLIVGVILLTVPLGWFLYSAFAPNLLFHSTTRALYGYRNLPAKTEVSLVPDLFRLGQTRDEVHASISGSALEPRPISDLPDVPGIVEGYSLDAGHDIGCSYRLLIVINYDDADLLQSASARRQSGTCF